MNPIRSIRQQLLAALSGFLAAPCGQLLSGPTVDELAPRLRAGDLLLVGGNTRFARIIGTLTGSRWTHVAVCVRDGGPALAQADDCVIEADLVEGVRLVGLDEFANRELLVLRPVGLDDRTRAMLVRDLRSRLGHGYDLDHILSLAKVLLSRRMRSALDAIVGAIVAATPAGEAEASGTTRSANPIADSSPRPADPTRAICSTLTARALEAAGLTASIPAPRATRVAQRAIDHLVPGDFEHAAGMATVLDSRRTVAPRLQPALA